jgi:exodeoxyribonuclease VII small subunit
MAVKKTDYKELSGELDEILSRLQSADLDIDEAVKAYERGMAIAKELEDYLKTAENKIVKIKADWDSKPKQP